MTQITREILGYYKHQHLTVEPCDLSPSSSENLYGHPVNKFETGSNHLDDLFPYFETISPPEESAADIPQDFIHSENNSQTSSPSSFPNNTPENSSHGKHPFLQFIFIR